MTFIDLFAGIGGMKMAFEQAGFKCLFSNDFDKYCEITFNLNFSKPFELNKYMVLGDISKISLQNIPKADILVAGFPCQPFSVAGYREGFSDKKGRGNVFFEIIKILKDKKPKAFLLENVKNLKTHDNGDTIKVIYEELEALGYYVVDKVLNSMEYGNLPQNRERIYIVGFKNKKDFEKFKFPTKIMLKKNILDCLEKGIEDKYYYTNKTLYEKLKNEVTKKGIVYQ